MRALVVTLVARHYGQAIVSRLDALQAWEQSDPTARIDVLSIYGQPEPGLDNNEIVTRKYAQVRETFLAGTWDVLITIEDDMVIPLDTFTRLLAVLDGGADVAYGLYVWRAGEPRWSAYRDVRENSGLSISLMGDAPRRYWGTVQDVAGVGQGCTAYSRSAIERVPFAKHGDYCCDWDFALAANREGLIQRCDLGLVCGHMAVVDEPLILWPDPNADNFVRVEFLATEGA